MTCEGFLIGRTCAYALVHGAVYHLFEGLCHVQWCVLGVYGTGMALGSLSTNGHGCVSVLLMVWLSHLALDLSGLWVGLCLNVEMEAFGGFNFSSINIP